MTDPDFLTETSDPTLNGSGPAVDELAGATPAHIAADLKTALRVLNELDLSVKAAQAMTVTIAVAMILVLVELELIRRRSA